MRERREEAARGEMRRREEIAHRRDRRERHAPTLCRVVELLDRLLAAPLLQEHLQRVEVRAARETVREELHLGPLRPAHDLDELPPLVLLDAADEDPAVAALHEAERLDRLRAEARGDEAAVGPELERELEDRRETFLRGDLDVL